MAALPIHPTTGLRAIYVSERTGRTYWPVLGASEPAGEPPAGEPPAAEPPASDPGFPAGTPLEQMSGEQQAAYWKDKARKHEDRVKAYGNLKPEEIAALRDKAKKHDDLELERASDAEKQAHEARAAATAEADAKYQPLLAETAFRVAIGDRKTQEEVDEFIADLNLPRFLTDEGRIDTAKVLARVEQFAPATGNQQQQRTGPSSSGQGNRTGNNRSAPGSGSVASGRDLYAEAHARKSS